MRAPQKLYGFYEECRRFFSIALWKRIQSLFDALPLSALVGGGISLRVPDELLATDVLVGTPGAVQLLLSGGRLRLDALRHVAVDEADSLLDDSFSNAVLRMLHESPLADADNVDERDTARTQLLLATPTLPVDLETLLESIMDPHSRLYYATTEQLHRLQPHVSQTFLRVREDDKQDELLVHARAAVDRSRPTLIFCKDGATTGWLAAQLSESGVPCVALHGRMDVDERRANYERFLVDDVRVLVTTDLGARGLDTCQVELIVNYNFAQNMADYVHRAARVGRVDARRRGVAVGSGRKPAADRVCTASWRSRQAPTAHCSASERAHVRQADVAVARAAGRRRRARAVRRLQRAQAALHAAREDGLVGGGIFCTHGGLSPHQTHSASMRAIARSLHDRTDVGVPVDLLWPDPEREDSARGLQQLLKQQPRLILVAARSIAPREELLYDYGERNKDAIASHPWLRD